MDKIDNFTEDQYEYFNQDELRFLGGVFEKIDLSNSGIFNLCDICEHFRGYLRPKRGWNRDLYTFVDCSIHFRSYHKIWCGKREEGFKCVSPEEASRIILKIGDVAERNRLRMIEEYKSLPTKEECYAALARKGIG